MIAALASRLLPTLEQDAAGLVLGARARAASLNRRRPAAALAGPLLGLSLERRRPGGGDGGARLRRRTATRAPQPRLPTAERRPLAVAALTAVAVAVAIPLDDYRYYDLLGYPVTVVGVTCAAVVTVAGAAAAVLARRIGGGVP